MERPNKPERDQLSGRRLEPAAAIVIYNRQTGLIFGTHYFAVEPGAELPDSKELERLALEQAGRDGCDARKHKVLHVDPVSLKEGCSYRVSAKGVLVENKQGRARKLTPKG